MSAGKYISLLLCYIANTSLFLLNRNPLAWNSFSFPQLWKIIAKCNIIEYVLWNFLSEYLLSSIFIRLFFSIVYICLLPPTDGRIVVKILFLSVLFSKKCANNLFFFSVWWFLVLFLADLRRRWRQMIAVSGSVLRVLHKYCQIMLFLPPLLSPFTLSLRNIYFHYVQKKNTRPWRAVIFWMV